MIDQPKHDDLTAKHDAVVAAKTPAEAAVNNLPEGPEKEALKGRLDAVDGIQVPAVNDADGNGKPDSQEHRKRWTRRKIWLQSRGSREGCRRCTEGSRRCDRPAET
ncbi:Uncharacterised protein [Escherichia coli]|uniref:GA-like domain-containing protein n=1 Tax=Escherichia coli TaxID=562 RepID=UPI000DFAB1AC|nr:hypothetical protein [Escherichia coli]STO19691.1 Uncharacterised protein [Escherichia coli]